MGIGRMGHGTLLIIEERQQCGTALSGIGEAAWVIFAQRAPALLDAGSA
jgi:hypothetical protein